MVCTSKSSEATIVSDKFMCPADIRERKADSSRQMAKFGFETSGMLSIFTQPCNDLRPDSRWLYNCQLHKNYTKQAISSLNAIILKCKSKRWHSLFSFYSPNFSNLRRSIGNVLATWSCYHNKFTLLHPGRKLPIVKNLNMGKPCF